MKQIKYEVGIPIRNEENTISQTLESISKQTIPPKNIYVCVNGSVDNTYQKVSDIASIEKNISLITSKPGKANAWNKIVSKSIENKLMFCDGDVIINPSAAEKMLETFEKSPDLVLVGGSNAYTAKYKESIFSKFFAENLEGTPISQNWVSGRLYMTKINELYNLAEKLKLNLMPEDILNEDQLLELMTKGHRKIIKSAYNISNYASNFKEWKMACKRTLSGRRQLQDKYPQLQGETNFLENKLKNYWDRTKDVNGTRRKLGVTSLCLIKKALKLYYNLSNNLDLNPLWDETLSTKVEIN